MSVTCTTKRTPTNAAWLGIKHINKRDLSDYAHFFLTFLGYEFHDIQANKGKSKMQVYWADPLAATKMAQTLQVPAQYNLVETGRTPVRDTVITINHTT